jgi:hypothetical protein
MTLTARTKYSVLVPMHYKIHSISKVCALVAATLIIPALAYAGTDNGKGNDGQNNGKQNGRDNTRWFPRQTQGGC